MLYPLSVLNLFGFSLLFVAWLFGIPQEIYAADSSHLSVVIFGVFLLGIFFALRSAYNRTFKLNNLSGHNLFSLRFIANSCVVLGLIGTVLGFIQALNGIDPQAAANVDQISGMVSALISGMGVALYTTLVGSVLALWLLVNDWLIKIWTRS